MIHDSRFTDRTRLLLLPVPARTCVNVVRALVGSVVTSSGFCVLARSGSTVSLESKICSPHPAHVAGPHPRGFGYGSGEQIAVAHPSAGTPMGAHTHPVHTLKYPLVPSVGCKSVSLFLVESP